MTKKKPNRLRSNPSRLGTPGERIKRTASWRDDKASSTQRGYTYEWQQARLEWLRDNPLCVMCIAAKRVRQATHVDHIKAHQGDQVLFWDRTNWQSLCSHCHNATKQRIERANVRTSNVSTRITHAQRASAHDAYATPGDLTEGEGGVKVQPPVDT